MLAHQHRAAAVLRWQPSVLSPSTHYRDSAAYGHAHSNQHSDDAADQYQRRGLEMGLPPLQRLTAPET
jgi:hypothetical protein